MTAITVIKIVSTLTSKSTVKSVPQGKNKVFVTQAPKITKALPYYYALLLLFLYIFGRRVQDAVTD